MIKQSSIYLLLKEGSASVAADSQTTCLCGELLVGNTHLVVLRTTPRCAMLYKICNKLKSSANTARLNVTSS